MLADYQDIIDAINGGVRLAHDVEAEHSNFFPEGCTGEMGTFGVDKACACTVEPTWYDENGCPRYCVHHPKRCPDIYADEVALLRIACQSCQREFRVQMSSNGTRKMLEYAVVSARIGAKIPPAEFLKIRGETVLSKYAKDGTIHYGDPPRHSECGAGDTMNCDDLEVLEFWSRCDDDGDRDWHRVPELERVLPNDDAGENYDL